MDASEIQALLPGTLIAAIEDEPQSGLAQIVITGETTKHRMTLHTAGFWPRDRKATNGPWESTPFCHDGSGSERFVRALSKAQFRD